MEMADYMDKYRAESSERHKDHLGKVKAYQGFEKERTTAQAEMHAKHTAGMDAIHATTLERNAADDAKTRAAEKTRGKYWPKDMKK